MLLGADPVRGRTGSLGFISPEFLVSSKISSDKSNQNDLFMSYMALNILQIL